MKLYDGYKQFVGRQICFDLTETMEAWSNVNTFVGTLFSTYRPVVQVAQECLEKNK